MLWKALWPVLLGAVLAIALWRWWRSLPRIPKGDIIVALDGGMQMAVAWGKALERMDRVLRQWPAAGVVVTGRDHRARCSGIRAVKWRADAPGRGSHPGYRQTSRRAAARPLRDLPAIRTVPT